MDLSYAVGTGNYSWIGHSVRTHEKSICRETKKAITNPKPRTKKFLLRRIHWCEANFHIFFFWRVILKNR